MRVKDRQYGFTIVELLLVIAVIGILAGITIVAYNGWKHNVIVNQVQSDLAQAASSMESAKTFGTGYPASLPSSFIASANSTVVLTSSTSTSFCIDATSTTDATIHYYVDNNQKTPQAGTCATRTATTAPGTPTAFASVAVLDTQVNFTWTPADGTATTFTIQCSTDTAYSVNFFSLASTVSPARMTGLTPSTKYFCRMNASNSYGTSAWTTNISLTTDAVGVVSTFAGQSTSGFVDATGTSAKFNFPITAVFDSSGNLYVLDGGNTAVRKITPSGVVTTFAGQNSAGFVDATGTSAKFSQFYGIAIDGSSNLYVADSGNNAVRKITPAGVVTTFAGQATAGFVDATGTSAKFNGDRGIAIDSSGNIFVVDSGNNAVRKITPAGVVTTFAGQATAGFVNATGTTAQFNNPKDLKIDSSNNLYVFDYGNNAIRKITPAGVVTTFAGQATAGYTDATGTTAQFTGPVSGAFDNYGNLIVADYGNNLIRRVTPDGVVTTVAGQTTAGFVNGSGTTARFSSPRGIAVDTTGNIFVMDYANNAIREIQ